MQESVTILWANPQHCETSVVKNVPRGILKKNLQHFETQVTTNARRDIFRNALRDQGISDFDDDIDEAISDIDEAINSGMIEVADNGTKIPSSDDGDVSIEL